MSLLTRVPLKTKLFTFVAVSAVGLIAFGIASYVMRQSDSMLSGLRVFDDVNADAVLPDLNAVEVQVSVSEILITEDPKKLNQLIASIKNQKQAFAVAEQDVLSRLPAGRTSELVRGKAHEAVMEYYEIVDQQFLPQILKGDRLAAQRVLPELMTRYEASQAATAEMVQADTDEGKAARDAAGQVMARRTIMLLLLGVILVVIVSALGFTITRSVRSGLAAMLTTIKEVAANNLACPDAEIAAQDEIGKASQALNTMKNNLHSLIQSIARTADHVASASEELSSSATLQSRGADTQRDQTSQVATAMQEMSSTVSQVSENSSCAAEASSNATELRGRAAASWRTLCFKDAHHCGVGERYGQTDCGTG